MATALLAVAPSLLRSAPAGASVQFSTCGLAVARGLLFRSRAFLAYPGHRAPSRPLAPLNRACPASVSASETRAPQIRPPPSPLPPVPLFWLPREFRSREDPRIMPADAELSSLLSRRQRINDELEEGKEVKKQYKFVNVYTEFHELSRREIKQYEQTFNRFDDGRDGYLDLSELKRMMEVLGAPQTHLGLKAMIQEVDEDGDGRISFREFLLIYRKARAGELEQDSGLSQLARLTEVDVDEVGVTGAKNFFEAKIEQLRKASKFENEIRMEQEERKREEEEKAARREQFRQKAAIFGK